MSHNGVDTQLVDHMTIEEGQVSENINDVMLTKLLLNRYLSDERIELTSRDKKMLKKHLFGELVQVIRKIRSRQGCKLSKLGEKQLAAFSPTIPGSLLMEMLLHEDKVRADLEPYNEKILTDTNLGHWSLHKNNAQEKNKTIRCTLNDKLVARNPISSIVDGVVGIDFGTKSTVVVYQKDTVDIYPMRVGTGQLSQQVSKAHYENPTVMECRDLAAFIEAYEARDGRPFTKWEQLTISHTAASNMLNSKSDFYNTFISELKQWAGDKQRKLKVLDRKDFVRDLQPFLDVPEGAFNPIELYAYYLGLYINNQRNGIFLNYILSFPVTYEVKIREKIVSSFKAGLLKSLPQELHNQMDVSKKLQVHAGASEPAAYAVVALQEYNFTPSDDEKVFYGVFDFGGGTTDFDFGIFREANGKKERRYDYVIEHFGAGGDQFLGGENLLELLAFEVFKANYSALASQQIQFVLPPECQPFMGSEMLLANTREAKINTKTLMEKLRPFWEASDEQVLDEGCLVCNLFDKDANQILNVDLSVDKEHLESILKSRIQKGVESFFHGLRIAFSNQKVDLTSVDKIHIFLAGNSSKSQYVQDAFEQQIQSKEEEMGQAGHGDLSIFQLFPPLSSNTLEKPNGKTGVAFGLIHTRKGGDILVIDHNAQQSDEIRSRFYLGDSRKQIFKVIMDRSTPYHQWVDFIDAAEDTFEVFYSSSDRVSSNRVNISDNSIKKKLLHIDTTDEDASVFVRFVTPTAFEYVVAYENELKNESYMTEITRVELK